MELVRDASRTEGLLLQNHRTYVLVFDLPQLLLGYAVLLKASTGIQQGLRPQQAPDVIGAKRRIHPRHA